jgi:3-hydroxy-9,10-secoandrosta-1,3,5(10)-triene-9,17-dione monooxygenase
MNRSTATAAVAARYEERPAIPAPEPDMTPDRLVQRAESMCAVLRERQPECEAAGCLPAQTNREFDAAGFYRTIQPRYFGGYEFDLPSFMRVIMAVSRGCSESGWVLALIAGHPNLVARLPVKGQREAYGETGEFRGPGVAMATGTAIAVAGGYQVKGTWDYGSGCDAGTHFLGMALLISPDSPHPLGTLWVLFDRDQYEIVDNWSVFGMQGTGSRRVVVKELFVPAHRVTPWADAHGSMIVPPPDRTVYTSPLYYGKHVPALISELASVAVGAARGALDEYEETLRRKRRTFPPFDTLFELPEFQQHFGEAQSLIDTAEAALLRMGTNFMEHARRAFQDDVPFSDETERRLLMIEQQCVRLAWEAVELMFRTAGSASAGKSSRLGRYFRNMAVIRTHITLQIEHTSINAARLHFGSLPLGPF